MTDITRLRMLSGIQQPMSPVLEQLKADRAATIAAFDKLIADAAAGKQLDEGIFTNLKATFATLGHLTGASIKKVSDAAKKASDQVKQIYLTNKAKAELEVLTKNIKQLIADFEEIEKDAATIISKDPEVKTEMELFAKVLNKLLESLQVRMELSNSSSSGTP